MELIYEEKKQLNIIQSPKMSDNVQFSAAAHDIYMAEMIKFS